MSDDISLESHEHREHAEHAASLHDPFLQRVSVTIAALAVIAATISSLANNASGAAMSAKNDAVLHQNRATDEWGFFQAKTIKEAIYAIAADHGGPKTEEYRKESARHGGDTKAAQKQAKDEEALTAAKLEEGEHAEHRHHVLDVGETLTHVAIAVATIAIITRQRWPWIASIALGAAGAVIAIAAFF